MLAEVCVMNEMLALRSYLRSMKERKHLNVVCKRSARPTSEYYYVY